MFDFIVYVVNTVAQFINTFINIIHDQPYMLPVFMVLAWCAIEFVYRVYDAIKMVIEAYHITK